MTQLKAGGLSRLMSAVLLCTAAMPVAAQTGAVSQADIARPEAVQRLNSALHRLVSDSRDANALIQAGEAALELDDPNAAMGFFGRADEAAPSNGRAKAGLGRAMLGLQRLPDALRLMEQARGLGYSSVPLLTDLGLAYDLNGEPDKAQGFYASALGKEPGNRTAIRRYAVSLGISGRLDQAEQTLAPLLTSQERAPWRDRAFILAMNGQWDRARQITQQVMPQELAQAIAPYMNRMHMLTPAQKAQAVHQGKFPDGLVKVAIAPYQPPRIAAASVPVAAPRVPAKESRAERRQREMKEQEDARRALAQQKMASNSASRPPAASPARSTVAARPAVSPPAPARQVETGPAVANPAPIGPEQAPASSPQLAVAPARAVVQPLPTQSTQTAQPAAPVAAASSASTGNVPGAQTQTPSTATSMPARPAGPTPDGPPVAGSAVIEAAPKPGPSVPAMQPVAPAATSPAPAAVTPSFASAAQSPSPPPSPSPSSPDNQPERSLAEIMADLTIPAAERQENVAAVDLDEIRRMQEAQRKAEEAERAKREAAAKAKRDAEEKARKAAEEAERKRLAANPARSWVQIATGRNADALAFDFRKFKKEYADQIGKYGGGIVPYGSTRILLVGPLPTAKAADQLAADLRKAGRTSFSYETEAGQEVSLISGK